MACDRSGTERTYKIGEFAAMTGMTPSKVRFYDKAGLFTSGARDENGYRAFTPHDAFRANAFRVLLQYGFTVEKAIAMLDARQGTAEFEASLQEQHARLAHDADLLRYRLRRIDSALDLLAYEREHQKANPALMRRCITESKNAVANLLEIGYEFKEANFRFETPFIGEKGGFHLITTPLENLFSVWSDAIENYGIDVRFSTPMTSIVMDGEKAAGVLAEGPDGTVQVNAGAVIIATGGYLGNEDLQERFLHTRDLNVAKGGVSLCTGDGILAGEAVGAALEKTFGYCPCEYGGTNDKASRPAKQDKYDQNYAFKFGYYGNLLVDAEGKRFLNEGMLCDFPMSYGSEQTLHNNPWYAIVDQTYVDAMTNQGLYEYMKARGAQDGEYGDPATNWFIGAYFKDRILDKLPEDIEEGIAEGWCWKGDTIEEVAEKAGLDPAVVAATVERYNGFCESGVDEDFGANPWYLTPVTTGPFYITENYQSAWSTFGGLRIDDQCRVLTAADYRPIPGLYCAGTEAGSLYYSPYYDIPGFCYGLCIDSGYIAANEALDYITG